MKLAHKAAILAFACATFAAQAQEKVIRIGVLTPISGPGSYFGVMGEECSDASLAIAPILEQARVPQLNAGSVTMKLTESGYKYVFRIFPNAAQQSLPLAKVAYDRLGARTAVILYEKTNAGNDNADGFEKPFVAMGGKVLAKIDFGRDVNDFTAIATRIASLGKVDVLPTFALEGQQVRLAQAKVVRGGG